MIKLFGFHAGRYRSKGHMEDQKLQIAGIVDWEVAGWYPDYWEYLNTWSLPSITTTKHKWIVLLLRDGIGQGYRRSERYLI